MNTDFCIVKLKKHTGRRIENIDTIQKNTKALLDAK
jgi:hypothetical protein